MHIEVLFSAYGIGNMFHRYIEELENNPDIDRSETLGHFIKSRGYSEQFQKGYLVRDTKLCYDYFKQLKMSTSIQ